MKPWGFVLLLGLSACQMLPQEIQIRLITPSSAPFSNIQSIASPRSESRVVWFTPAPDMSASPSDPPATDQAAAVSPNASALLSPTPEPDPEPDPRPISPPASTSPPPSSDFPGQPSPTPVQNPSAASPLTASAAPSVPPPTPSAATPTPAPTPHPTPQPTATPPYIPPSAAAVSYTNRLGMHFRKLPAGSFFMGSDPAEAGRKEDETRHEVSLGEFWLQTTEVTQGQWQAVMGHNPAYFPTHPERPVEMVSWHDAARFVAVLNTRGEGRYRLPTEAEWEYAARAGSPMAYACGEIGSPCLAEMSWFFETTGGIQSRPVADKLPNAWGLYDMHGNVSEWVNDWYGPYPEQPPMQKIIQPTGPAFGSLKVNRGGSWGGQALSLRAAQRTAHEPNALSSKLGFRVVFEP